jgi:beta-lactamase class D
MNAHISQRMRYLLAGAISCVLAHIVCEGASAETRREHPELARFFTEAGTTGTMVIHDHTSDHYFIIAPERAATAFAPSSTFKIPNTLIALETRAAKGMDETFAYNGKPFLVRGKLFLPEGCNTEVKLTVALQLSCIPVYQELARRVGVKAYNDWLTRLGYGSGQVTQENLTEFWLNGGIQTSAFQQIEFLDRLVTGKLPLAPEHVKALAEALTVERRPDEVLYAKTGYVFTCTPEIGWYVGWVEHQGRIATFALNLDITRPDHPKARKEIVLSVLRHLGLFGS